MVKSPSGQAVVNAADTEIARQYQAMALAAFAQDFEVWKHKRPCFKGLFVQGDGPFLKQRTKRDELLKGVDGTYLAKGMPGMPMKSAA